MRRNRVNFAGINFHNRGKFWLNFSIFMQILNSFWSILHEWQDKSRILQRRLFTFASGTENALSHLEPFAKKNSLSFLPHDTRLCLDLQKLKRNTRSVYHAVQCGCFVLSDQKWTQSVLYFPRYSQKKLYIDQFSWIFSWIYEIKLIITFYLIT